MLGLALVVAAVVLAVPAARDLRASRGVRERLGRARTASGEVVSVGARDGHVLPTVRYHVAGAALQTTPRTPPPGTRYLVGQPVDVRYDPEEPAWMTVEAVPGDARPPAPRRGRLLAAAAAALLVGAAALLALG